MSLFIVNNGSAFLCDKNIKKTEIIGQKAGKSPAQIQITGKQNSKDSDREQGGGGCTHTDKCTYTHNPSPAKKFR